MIKAVISDFSRVLLFPKDGTYAGSLNELHKNLSATQDYNPLDHFSLNDELLTYYRFLKNTVDLYLFTSDVIQDAPAFQNVLKPVFDKIFSASAMHTRKDDPDAYRRLAHDLNIAPHEILYIDDNTANIHAAMAAGLTTLHYQNNQDLLLQMQQTIAP